MHTLPKPSEAVNQIRGDLMSETGSSFHADHSKTLLVLHTPRGPLLRQVR
jgi:hypothetical protein